MSDFRQLNESVLASPQITMADLEAAKDQGVTLVINNRPDGEEAGQPTSAEMEQAARDLGLDYKAIPITHAGFSMPQIEEMQSTLASADGKTLAYCRSGTRSTFLWALALAKQGARIDSITSQAAAAGYDVSPIRPMMDMLSGQSGNS